MINMLNFSLHTIELEEGNDVELEYREPVTGEVFRKPLGGPFIVDYEGDDEWGYWPYLHWNPTRKAQLFMELAGPIPHELINECELHNAVQWASFPTTYTQTDEYEGDGYRPGKRYSYTTRDAFFYYDPTQKVLGPHSREGLSGWVQDSNRAPVRDALEEHRAKYDYQVRKALFQEAAEYMSSGLVRRELTPDEEFCLQWKHFKVSIEGVVHYLAVEPGYRETSNEFPTTMEVGLYRAPKGWKTRRLTPVKVFGYIRYADALLNEPECCPQYKAGVDAIWQQAIKELTTPQAKLTTSGKPFPKKK